MFIVKCKIKALILSNKVLDPQNIVNVYSIYLATSATRVDLTVALLHVFDVNTFYYKKKYV